MPGPWRDTPVLHSVATFPAQGADPKGAPDLMLWISDPGQPGEPPQVAIDIVLLTPRSRGTVLLRSSDPSEPPRIELPRLDDPFDLERLAEGYERAYEVASHPTVRAQCEGKLPARAANRDALRDAVRRGRYSIPHVVGTCAMGPSPEAGGVVDADGRVHGASGLVVADASIMPTVPSGFSHLPTIMIAERLAELLAARA